MILFLGLGGRGGRTLAPGEREARGGFPGGHAVEALNGGQQASECHERLMLLVDADVKVFLEVQAVIASGAPENVVRTVTENANTLKVKGGFERE